MYDSINQQRSRSEGSMENLPGPQDGGKAIQQNNRVLCPTLLFMRLQLPIYYIRSFIQNKHVCLVVICCCGSKEVRTSTLITLHFERLALLSFPLSYHIIHFFPSFFFPPPVPHTSLTLLFIDSLD